MKRGNIITDPQTLKGDFFEQFYTNKFHPGMNDKFLKKHRLPKLTQKRNRKST